MTEAQKLIFAIFRFFTDTYRWYPKLILNSELEFLYIVILLDILKFIGKAAISF